MTNPLLPDHGAPISPELAALAPVGGKRRPVKVVEHPAFRVARARLAAHGPFLAARVPVVRLNGPVARAERGDPVGASTRPLTSCVEAA